MAVNVEDTTLPACPEAGFHLNPVGFISPVRDDHFSLQKWMVMQPDINLMHTFQKLFTLVFCTFELFRRGDGLVLHVQTCRQILRLVGNFLFVFFFKSLDANIFRDLSLLSKMKIIFYS